MGSFNVACALTHTPILAGDPVVVLTCFPNVDGHSDCQHNKTHTLLGLPVIAEYYDYGDFEDVLNPMVAELNKSVSENNNFYRTINLTGPFNMNSSKLMVKSIDALFAAEDKIIPLFASPATYSIFVSSYKTSSKHSKLVYEKAGDYLKKLVEELNKIPDQMEDHAFDKAIESAFVTVFKTKASMAYTLLKSSIFSHSSLIYMHKLAYDTVVKELGSRLVKFQGNSVSVRQVVTNKWHQFLEDINRISEYDKTDQEMSKLLKMSVGHRYGLISPIRAPWSSSRAPLVGHYWDSVPLDTLVNAVSEVELVDFLIFGWARHYMAIDLVPNSGLGQCEEVKLMQSVSEAVYSMLKSNNRISQDFDYYGG